MKKSQLASDRVKTPVRRRWLPVLMNKIQLTSDRAKKLLRRRGLPALLFFSFVIIILAIWKVPQRQAEGIADPKDHATIENAARVTLIQGFGGVFVITTAYFTWRNFTVAQEKQLTDRFAKAIELLGNDNSIHVRLGAIYALERISKDSGKDYPQVMEILTAYVRETSPYPPKDLATSQNLSSIATDIQAVLTVITRRSKSKGQGEENELDLSKSNLSRAILIRANLSEAYLSGADLSGAYLIDANLSGANLFEANLSGAYLIDANLSGVELSGANLSGAILIGANLSGTRLFRTDFSKANLSGANLSGVKYLSREQVQSAENGEQAIYDKEFRQLLGLPPEQAE